MGTIQLIQISKEELQELIVEGVKSQIADLVQAKKSNENDELITRNELAAILKVDLSTVAKWTKKGKLISYGIGGRVYYKKSEIEQVLTRLN